MGSVMREIEYIEPSYEWEIFLREYVSKSDLSKLFNVSKAWIDKVFYDEKEKIKVYLISVRDGINGEKEEHRNRYIYYSKYYVQCILREAKWYRFTGNAEDLTVFQAYVILCLIYCLQFRFIIFLNP